MSDRELANEMLLMAGEDLDTLRRMLRDPGFPENAFGFHAQQAVEKALKAWLTARGVEFPKTHDLEILEDLVSDHGASIPEEFEPLLNLSAFGVKFRYQPYTGLYEALDRAEVARLVERLISFVKGPIEET
jgi:HEPN domain-containing protein